MKNIVSIKLSGMDMVTASSIPPSKKGLMPKHSEQVVWERVQDEVAKGRKIEWVYTEREPCGKGPGMKNCAAFLNDLLAKYGAQGDQTPVYCSFLYPSSQEVREVAAYFLQQGVIETEDDAYNAALRPLAPRARRHEKGAGGVAEAVNDARALGHPRLLDRHQELSQDLRGPPVPG